jgi:hypothetical protein
MNDKTSDLDLINKAKSSIEKIQYKDGTVYYRMPNGNLVRSSQRAYEIRKQNLLK